MIQILFSNCSSIRFVILISFRIPYMQLRYPRYRCLISIVDKRIQIKIKKIIKWKVEKLSTEQDKARTDEVRWYKAQKWVDLPNAAYNVKTIICSFCVSSLWPYRTSGAQGVTRFRGLGVISRRRLQIDMSTFLYFNFSLIFLTIS